ncbi:MAG: phosphatidylinositol-specific phospholipase C/glycerophosphodiester phosphodiesterase family protein [Acetatifactor sp.]
MEEKKLSKWRVATGILTGIALLAAAAPTFDMGARRFVICALLSIGVAVCIALPTLCKRDYISAILLLLYLIYVPFKIAQRIDVTVYHTERWLTGLDIVSIGMVLCVYLTIYLFTRRIWLSLGGGSALLTVLLTVGYYICVPQMPGTIFQWSQEFIYSFLLLLFFTALGFRIHIRAERNRHLRLTLSVVSAIFVLSFCALTIPSGCWRDTSMGNLLKPVDIAENAEWYEFSGTVQHALGETEQGDTLTNSFEAFQYHYAQGQRVFEADIQTTSDNQMVLRHDWASDLGQGKAFGWTEENREVPTAEDFLSTPIYGQYTPLSLADWFKIMKKYQDIYLVTDTKYLQHVEEDFQLLVNTAKQADCEEVLDRVIVQIYYQDMYREIMNVYPFPNVLFTLYYIGYDGPEETAGFCEQNHIPVLTMPAGDWSDQMRAELSGYDTRIYVHTVNDEAEARKLIEKGVSGIYTDSILNKTVLQWADGMKE